MLRISLCLHRERSRRRLSAMVALVLVQGELIRSLNTVRIYITKAHCILASIFTLAKTLVHTLFHEPELLCLTISIALMFYSLPQSVPYISQIDILTFNRSIVLSGPNIIR